MRYYRSEQDLKSEQPVDSLNPGIPGIKVFFDSNDLPQSILYLDKNHHVWQERINQYNQEGMLSAVTVFDKSRTAIRKTVYGPEEAWSKSFRKFAFPKSETISFAGSRTEFRFKEKGVLNEIKFFTVTGMTYGLIRFHYNYLGYLQEEEWYQNPGHVLIRRFVYDRDIDTGEMKLWEYNGAGEEISYVSLEMAPADQLYPYPQPRTGNVLDEANIIINDIRKTGISPSFPARIPSTAWDRLRYSTGETVDIRLIDIADGYITFTFPGEEEELHLPLSRVKQVRTRWGEQLFP